MKKENSLKEIALLFLKLGTTGFGGPAVHIAMMEEEVVRKKKWFSQDYFLDLIGATNLIPGPNSTEMTMHCGREKAGMAGLIVAGCCFILPAVLITGIIAWAYKNYGKLPEVEPFIYGIKPAIISVIAALMITLGKKALKTKTLVAISIIALVLALCGLNEIVILFGGGFAGILLYLAQDKTTTIKKILPLTLYSGFTIDTQKLKLFFTFLKIGAILYGSGYVLFAFLDEELVAKGLLTKRELIDAIAVGQFTPGPVFSSATFIGWQIGGPGGALLATIGIFLPSFLFVALLNPIIPILRRSNAMSAFLDAVNSISIALILAVCIEMSKDAITDWRTTTIAVAGLAITFTFKNLNTAWVILGGSVLGFVLS